MHAPAEAAVGAGDHVLAPDHVRVVDEPQGRTRIGFLEEIRALLAHALLADRPTEDTRTRIQNAVMNTFATLEGFVIAIMNGHAGEGIKFVPKSPLEPPDGAPGAV